MAFIEVENVGKTFHPGIVALKGVCLQIEEGEVVSILGPSGSGKSTLVRCINGLETPTTGRVLVDGIEVNRKNLRQVRGQVGMVFQRFNLIPRLNVLSNVLVGRLAHRSWLTSTLGWFPAADHELAHAALAEVKLLDRIWDRADKLSGGQQQRVGIARTLVQQARVILADEPVASLDPTTSHEIMRLLVKVVKLRSATVVVNLHQVELAKKYTKRIIGLRAGELIFDLPADQVTDYELAELYGKSGLESEATDILSTPENAVALC